MQDVDKRTPGRWTCPRGCETTDTEATPIGTPLACPQCGASAAVVARVPTTILARREADFEPLTHEGITALGTIRFVPGEFVDVRLAGDPRPPAEAEGLSDAALRAFEGAPPARSLLAMSPRGRTHLVQRASLDIVRRPQRARLYWTTHCGANPHHHGLSVASALVPGAAYVAVCDAPGCNWFEVSVFHDAQPPSSEHLAGFVERTARVSGHIIVTGVGAVELAGKEKACALARHFDRAWGTVVERGLEPTCPDDYCDGRLSVNADIRTGGAWRAFCRGAECGYEETGTIEDAGRCFAEGVVEVRLETVRGSNLDPSAAEEWTMTVRDIDEGRPGVIDVELTSAGPRVALSREAFEARRQCNVGFCHGCGAEVRGVAAHAKPHAVTPDNDGGPKCSRCGAQSVCGVEQAQAEGWLRIKEEVAS